MALYRHRVVGTSPGEQWSFTLHTTGTVPVETANITWASAVAAMWTGNLDALISSQISVIERTTVTINEETEGQIARADDDAALPGVATDSMLPFQVSLAVSLSTTLANRHGRGRFYLPPLTAASLAVGRVAPSSLTTIGSAVGALFSGLAGGNLTPVVRDRTGHISTVVTSASVGDVFDTQRRRRNKLVEERVTIVV